MPNELSDQELPQPLNATNNTRLSLMLAALFRGRSSFVTEAARHCSIPRYFNAELIATLAEEPITVEQAEAVLEEINDWEFVQELGNGRFAYRREIREHLRSELQRNSIDLFLSINNKAHSYFDSKLPMNYIINELSWSQLRGEQISALREKLYHLLQIDMEAGFSIFELLFRGAHRLFLLGEASALLKLVESIGEVYLNENIQNSLSYFNAMQRNADGEMDAAEAKLIDLQSKPLLPGLRIQVLTLLGTIHHYTGRLESALVLFQEAQKISASHQLIRQNAALSNNLGNVYLSKNDLKNAETYFEQARSEFQKLGSISDEASVLNNLGAISLKREEFGLALYFLEKSLELRNQIGDAFGAARTRANIAQRYQKMSIEDHNKKTSKENWEKALEHYLASLETFRKLGALSNEAKVLYQIAYFYHEVENDFKAKEYLSDAIPIFKTLRLKKELEVSSSLAKTIGL